MLKKYIYILILILSFFLLFGCTTEKIFFINDTNSYADSNGITGALGVFLDSNHLTGYADLNFNYLTGSLYAPFFVGDGNGLINVLHLSDLTGYVPFQGATEDVNLYNNDLIVRFLLDKDEIRSVSVGSRTLYDVAEVSSVNWEVKLLNDDDGNNAIQWGNRFLVNENQELVAQWGDTFKLNANMNANNKSIVGGADVNADRFFQSGYVVCDSSNNCHFAESGSDTNIWTAGVMSGENNSFLIDLNVVGSGFFDGNVTVQGDYLCDSLTCFLISDLNVYGSNFED